MRKWIRFYLTASVCLRMVSAIKLMELSSLRELKIKNWTWSTRVAKKAKQNNKVVYLLVLFDFVLLKKTKKPNKKTPELAAVSQPPVSFPDSFNLNAPKV